MNEKDQHKQETFADILDGLFDYETSPMIRRKHLRGKKYSRNHADIQNRQYYNHIRPFFGEKDPRKIKATTVEDWIDTLLAKKLKAITIAHVFSTLKILFKELIRQEYLDRNPLEGVAISSSPRRPRKKTYTITWKYPGCSRSPGLSRMSGEGRCCSTSSPCRKGRGQWIIRPFINTSTGL